MAAPLEGFSDTAPCRRKHYCRVRQLERADQLNVETDGPLVVANALAKSRVGHQVELRRPCSPTFSVLSAQALKPLKSTSYVGQLKVRAPSLDLYVMMLVAAQYLDVFVLLGGYLTDFLVGPRTQETGNSVEMLVEESSMNALDSANALFVDFGHGLSTLSCGLGRTRPTTNCDDQALDVPRGGALSQVHHDPKGGCAVLPTPNTITEQYRFALVTAL